MAQSAFSEPLPAASIICVRFNPLVKHVDEPRTIDDGPCLVAFGADSAEALNGRVGVDKRGGAKQNGGEGNAMQRLPHPGCEAVTELHSIDPSGRRIEPEGVRRRTREELYLELGRRR